MRCRCGGRLAVHSVVATLRTAEEVLKNLGLWQPRILLPPPRGPPQLELLQQLAAPDAAAASTAAMTCARHTKCGPAREARARAQVNPAYPSATFVIEARDNSAVNLYVQSATLNGKPLTRAWLSHQELVAGGTLVLSMGPAPSAWGAQ